MKKTIVAAATLIAASTFAHAEDSAAIKDARAICAHKDEIVLSKDAFFACATEEWPRVVKNGERFRNTGVGAEFNTLTRNFELLVAAKNSAEQFLGE